ncbi:MAG: hypothetical protein SXV54_27600 [Chloroflexota bacterium]|nr:hypothetical protein [Chloroflexota bacterium]
MKYTLSAVGIAILFVLLSTWAMAGPTNPEMALAVDNPLWRIGGSLEAVDVQGDYAYLAQGTQLRVVNLTNLQTVGALSFRYPVRDVTVSGTHAYLVTNTYGDLHVVDVADPATPAVVGKGEVPGWSGGESIAVRGDYAYVLAENSSDGLVTFDITSPITPTFVTQTVGITGRWVRPGTDHLYVLRYDRLTVFDVTSAGNPQQEGTFDLTTASNLAVAEPYVYVTDYVMPSPGVIAVDVSTPSDPQEADSWTYTYGSGNTSGVAVSGNYAYVGYDDNGGVYSAIFVLNISDPANLTYVDKYQPVGSFYNFLIAGNSLYVAGGPSGDLMSISIANPESPAMVGTLYQVGQAEMVRLAGDRAYVVGPGDYYGTDASIWVYDVSDPLTPTLLHREDPYPNGIYDLEVAGNYVYLTGYGYGLGILDVADLSPRGSYAPDGVAYYCTDATIQGSLAYVIAPGVGVQADDIDVINVSDPDYPDRVKSVSTTGTDLRQVVADGNRLYATDYYQQFFVYDIASPQNPTLVTSYTLSGLMTLNPAGNYVYAGTQDGLTVLDVSDLNDIQPVGVPFDTLNAVKSIDVADDIAYLGCSNAAYALDVSNPISPTAIWQHTGPAGGLDIQGITPFVLVADDDLGLSLHAVSDGVVRPALGNAAKMFPDTALVVYFARDMDTGSVTFTCTPDPGGWEASWETHAIGALHATATGRVLTLHHNPFTENQDYDFQVTGGTTAGGQAIAPFSLDFFVIQVQRVYLPLILR